MLPLLITVCILAQAPAAPQDQAVTIALMHGVPVKWDLETNFQTFLTQLDDPDVAGAQIFITPECWLDGYAAPDPASTPERLRTVAQDLDSSPYLKRVAAEA